MKSNKAKYIWLPIALVAIAAAIITTWAISENMEAHYRFWVVERGVLYRARQPINLKANARKRNIRTVVNLREEDEDLQAFAKEKAQCQDLGIRWINIPITATLPSEEQIEQFLRLVRRNDGAVLVHCAQGRSRTGTMSAAYRVIVQGWSVQQAMDEMKRRGDHPGQEKYKLLSDLAAHRDHWLERTAANQQN